MRARHWAQLKPLTEVERTTCRGCRIKNAAGDNAWPPSYMPHDSYPCHVCGRPWDDAPDMPWRDKLTRPSERQP